MNQHELTHSHAYNIRSYETLPNRVVTICAICDQLQDIAARHADALGFGLFDLEKIDHAWILARLHVMLERLPHFGQSLTITTWPSGNGHLVANRDFIINDQNGVIGHATTSWVTLNLLTKRPARPDNVLNKRFIPNRKRALTFPCRAVTRLKKGEHQTSLTARRSDMDVNGHVNNVNYIRFCLEAVPEQWESTHQCIGLDIQFRTESFPGDSYTSFCTQETDQFLHGLRRHDDNMEIVRMRSWWHPNDPRK